MVGRGGSLPEIISLPSIEPWLLTGMCGPPVPGPPRAGGWREEYEQSSGGRLEGGTCRGPRPTGQRNGAGVSLRQTGRLLHQDGRQTRSTCITVTPSTSAIGHLLVGRKLDIVLVL